MTNYAVETQDLGRVYKIRGNKKERQERKELVALENVNLTVERGELFGLLGPNGAGKTTLIKILTTLLAPTSGWARVATHDVNLNPHRVRPLINMVSGGEASGYGLLTVRENLWMFSQFYGMDSQEANRRITELLTLVGLQDRINTKSSDLSTGLRQKMNIVRGFLTDPEVLFLDEPTLGLDVGASRDVRTLIRNWMDADRKRTLLLTTHYMVEAEELCDRVAIINKGRVLACDTPANLKRDLQRDAIFEIEISRDGGPTSGHGGSPSGHGGPPSLHGWNHSVLAEQAEVKKAALTEIEGGARLELILKEEAALANIINILTQKNIKVKRLSKHEPTLEDVFMELVGQRMEDVEKGGAE